MDRHDAALSALAAHMRDTVALAQVAGLLGWDQETMMPRGAAGQRAEWMGAMERMLHARRTDPAIPGWLADLDRTRLDRAGRRNADLIERAYRRATRVPAELASALATLTSRAQGIWAEARAADDFAAFAPTLSEIVSLKREEAAALADGGDPYDALLDDFEPGMTGAELDRLFGRLRPGLVALRDAIMGAPRQPQPLHGRFDLQAQLDLSRDLASRFGYDWTRGRLDLAVHPFSSGSWNDVRITTRVSEEDPFNCLYSTIHEVGHATYEQNIDPSHALTLLGQGVSMGIHESQSRSYENQIGRSRAFTAWLFGAMQDRFGDFGPSGSDAFFATVNRVAQGHVRTESDEVQYNLHIILRLDLERDLIRGRLDPADLEEAWNARFLDDFGHPVTRPSLGVLQDVHWSVGLFGYFPTYALGNIYAACLHERMRADLPDLDLALESGDPSPATAWMAEKVQRHGGLYTPAELIEQATGAAASEQPLLQYLRDKFGQIYDL